jgi:lysophospholipase L1-like esterase
MRPGTQRLLSAVAIVAAAAGLTGWTVAAERRNATGAPARVAPVTEVSPITAPSPWPQVAIIGDSYTGGSDVGGRGTHAWFRRTCHDLRWYCVAKPVAGSGWVAAPSGRSFGQRVPWAVAFDPDVVVFFNGVDDLQHPMDTIHPAAMKALEDLRAQKPDVEIIVIGPVSPRPIFNAALEMRDNVEAAALSTGAHFIDPLAERWFQGKSSRFIGSDKFHPTDAGHQYMADLITRDIRRLNLPERARTAS